MKTGYCFGRAVYLSFLALLLLSNRAFSQAADTADLRRQAEVFLRESFACYAANDSRGFVALYPDYRQFDSIMVYLGNDYAVRKLRELGDDTLLLKQACTGEWLELYARNFQRALKAGIHWQGLILLEVQLRPVPAASPDGQFYDLNFLVRDPANGRVKAGRMLSFLVYKGKIISGRMSVLLDAPKGLSVWIKEQSRESGEQTTPAPER